MELFDRIRRNYVIEDAYEKWADYRRALTDEILDHKDEAGEERTIALVGAGRLGDIDLPRIAAEYEQVTLIDYDEDAMMEGLEHYDLADDPRIGVRVESMTGISLLQIQHSFRKMCAFLASHGTDMTEEAFLKESLHNLNTLMERIYRTPDEMRGALPWRGYDAITCIGVHSQLFSLISDSWNVLAESVSEQILAGAHVDRDRFHDELRKKNDVLMPVLDTALWTCAGRRLVLGLEWDEVSPVEGAYQALRDYRMRELNGRVEGISRSQLTWPFAPEHDKSYEMLIWQIRGNNIDRRSK